MSKCRNLFLFLLLGALVVAPGNRASSQEAAPPAAAGAADNADEKKSLPPLAKFITVSGTVDEVMESRVGNLALSLQNEAAQQNRQAILVMEIHRGTSKFGIVRELAKTLTSAKLDRVKTVAWIPEKVDGNNVILALAANEIVMHPDAELGDIGLGKAVDKDERLSVMTLVERRHNAKVSPALALGMLDPQVTVVRIRVGQGAMAEWQVVTEEEAMRKRDAGVIITESQTLKVPGTVGSLTGSKARAHDVLVVQTAESRADVAELYDLPAEALREDPTAGEAPRVRLIKIDAMIEPVLETFVERQIQRSVAAGANMIIFEIESPGGYLIQSQNLASAIAGLSEHDVRTVAYIPKTAYSGAAMIAMACDEVYMHPHAFLGDIGVVQSADGQAFEFAPEKFLSPVRAFLRDLAKRKNRPPALLEAMCDRRTVVYQVTHKETGRLWYMTEEEIHLSNGEWIQGPRIDLGKEGRGEVGRLLTVSGQRAHELKLAEPPVRDFAELKDRLGIPADQKLVAVGRTWVDSLIFLLNTPQAVFLLMVIGIVCIYLELHMMTGLLGIISGLCFALFFWSKVLGGTAGWLEVVLFVLGLVCLAMEIFVMPGFGVFGVSGGLMMIASLVLASQTFGNLEPNADTSMLARSVGTLSAAVVAVVVIALAISRFLPSIPFLNQMILTPPGYEEHFRGAGGPKLRPGLADTSGAPADGLGTLIGGHGQAVTALRPAGKAVIEDHYLDVVSDGPYIDAGTPIKVVEISGSRIVVREA